MANNLSRSRGFGFEQLTVKRFKKMDGWQAWRLGRSSNTMPDILAIHNRASRLVAMELKTGGGKSLSVPEHQTKLILEWRDNLAAYKRRDAVIGFKFHSKPHVGRHTRAIKEHYFIIDIPGEYNCDYYGRLTAWVGDSLKTTIGKPWDASARLNL